MIAHNRIRHLLDRLPCGHCRGRRFFWRAISGGTLYVYCYCNPACPVWLRGHKPLLAWDHSLSEEVKRGVEKQYAYLGSRQPASEGEV